MNGIVCTMHIKFNDGREAFRRVYLSSICIDNNNHLSATTIDEYGILEVEVFFAEDVKELAVSDFAIIEKG